jgi:YbbR domain-containing protein
MSVGTSLETKTLAVNPVVTGTPGSGFELASVVVEPLSVSVQGDVDALRDLARIDTEPFSISGATSTADRLVELDLPEGITSLTPQVRIVATLRSVTATRSLEAAIVLAGFGQNRRYSLSTDRTVVALGGSTVALNAISGRDFAMVADVSDLGPGTHEVTLRAPSLPAGISLVTATPGRIRVTITVPPTPPPQPTPTPTPSPSPSLAPAAAPTAGAP